MQVGITHMIPVVVGVDDKVELETPAQPPHQEIMNACAYNIHRYIC